MVNSMGRVDSSTNVINSLDIKSSGQGIMARVCKIRTYAIISMIIVLLIGGFAPTSNPKSPEEWERHYLLKIQTHLCTLLDNMANATNRWRIEC